MVELETYTLPQPIENTLNLSHFSSKTHKIQLLKNL